ncbi:MAG: GNAT family N-acetyltransferase [Candidatus Micrarchaeota archaeon]|nr:GNAT family N-acetyltransferase [Candidatus Micrarchaeota archaeon]
MHIRKVKQSDFDQILEISDQGYEEARLNPDFGDYVKLKKPDKRRKAEWTAYMLKHIGARDMLFYVAEDKGVIIGYCFVMKKDIPDSEMSHVGVLAIRVAKDWRGRGVGTKLLGYAIKDSRKKFEIIEIFPFATNERSKRLYRRFGFKTWGLAPGYIKRGERYIDLEYMYLRIK